MEVHSLAFDARPLVVGERKAFREADCHRSATRLERRESAHEEQRRGNSDGGSKRVAAENAVPYHGGIDNRERSLFQGGWTLPRLSSLSLSCLLPFFSSLCDPAVHPLSPPLAPTTYLSSPNRSCST